MTYTILYSNEVVKKDIPKLSPDIRAIIKNTIGKKLVQDPVAFGKPLSYHLKGCRSLRIGYYRVLYTISENTVYIVAIKHRQDCYE